MSNYTPTTTFASLTGTPITGSPFDVEYGNIATAIATKYDNLSSSGNLTLTNITATSTLTGAAIVPSGSTVPAVGMYLPAANQIGFSTTSVQRLTISNTGQVSVNAPPSATTAMTIAGYSGGNQNSLSLTSGGLLIGSPSGTNQYCISALGSTAGNATGNGIVQIAPANGLSGQRFMTFNLNGNTTPVPFNFSSTSFITTGATTPVLTGNKPVGNGTSIAGWLSIDIAGVIYYMPVWN